MMDTMFMAIKALGDESRMRILWMLEDRYLCVCEIQEALKLAQSTVSRHMMLLEEAGLVISQKDGLWKNYLLNPSPTPEVQALIALVRMHARSSADALAWREKVRAIHRENICCR